VLDELESPAPTPAAVVAADPGERHAASDAPSTAPAAAVPGAARPLESGDPELEHDDRRTS
jgi:hypothetical protein